MVLTVRIGLFHSTDCWDQFVTVLFNSVSGKVLTFTHAFILACCMLLPGVCFEETVCTYTHQCWLLMLLLADHFEDGFAQEGEQRSEDSSAVAVWNQNAFAISDQVLKCLSPLSNTTLNVFDMCRCWLLFMPWLMFAMGGRVQCILATQL